MLMFDDQSMDDEESDYEAISYKSDILIQNIDPLFATTSIFSQSSSSPYKLPIEEHTSVET